jgi:hypothetical protein
MLRGGSTAATPLAARSWMQHRAGLEPEGTPEVRGRRHREGRASKQLAPFLAMPPRRGSRAAAAPPAAGDPPLTLIAFPEPVVHRIFSLLALDERLRCREVCRGWRAALGERSLWTHLDLTTVTLERPLLYTSLLLSAAACAGGALESLDVSARPLARGEYVSAPLIPQETLLDVVAANAGTLRELRQHTPGFGFHTTVAQRFLAAAPLLRTLTMGLCAMAPLPANLDALRSMLRNEPPFGPLRVSYLELFPLNANEADLVAFATDVAAHASLVEVFFRQLNMETSAAVVSLVDALLSMRCLRTLRFLYCSFPLDSAPVLMRLLGSTLTSFALNSSLHHPELHGAAGLLAAALRANTTLTSLDLLFNGMFEDAESAAQLFEALREHPSLRTLKIGEDDLQNAGVALEALGLLVAADAPALTHLEIAVVEGDFGLSWLLEALPQNTHLRTLLWGWYGISEALVNDVLLPAVRANTGLRRFERQIYPYQLAQEQDQQTQRAGVLEAQELVAQRPPVD